MTYRPERRIAFGPPLKQRLPSFAYLAFALAVCAVIVYGQHAPSGSAVFRYVVEGDAGRAIPSSVCAIILFCSAMAGVIREQMRGVIVHPEGIDVRELLTLGWPRVRRFHWSQIDKLFVPSAVQDHTLPPGDQTTDPAGDPPTLGPAGEAPPADQARSTPRSIRLDLWDGTRTWLPDVARAGELGMMLERVALARAIPIEGGTGLVDDLGNPLGD
jgi:hypothetical protein